MKNKRHAKAFVCVDVLFSILKQMSNKLMVSALNWHKSSSRSGEPVSAIAQKPQICLAPGGFALWIYNRVLPLYPAGGLGSPQTPLLGEAPVPASFSYSPAT